MWPNDSINPSPDQGSRSLRIALHHLGNFLAQFTPFEAAQDNPGMQKFLKAMKANASRNQHARVTMGRGADFMVTAKHSEVFWG